MRIVAALAALLVLSGCAGDGQVEALQEDPVATWSRPGVREVDAHVTEPGSTLGKPRYAQVLRILAIRDGGDVQAVLAEVQEVASRAGWSTEFEHDDAFGAEKPMRVDGEAVRAELTAGRQTVGGSPGAVEIYISATAYPA
jgi:hypothetical protein